MLFTYYKMKLLEIMLVTAIFSQRIVGEHNNVKIKRQIVPSLHNERVADYNSLQHLNEKQIFQERYLNHDEETVGLFPFGLMRGAARHFTQRAKHRRARLHHPHLLAPTPDHLLQENEKGPDRHDANEIDPILQSPQLHHEGPPPNVFQPPPPQTVIINRMQDNYKPLTAGKIICNFYDPEETVYDQPESKSRHSSDQEDVSQEPPDAANHFQARHFYHKGDVYNFISKHLQKHHAKFFDPINTPSAAPYSGNFNHHLPSNNDGSQDYGQNNNIPQSSTTPPISSINGEKITINQNFQISQIDGNNNAVEQSQASNNKHKSSNKQNDFAYHAQDNQNYQESQIDGSYNAVSQSQASHKNQLNVMQNDINNFFNNQNHQISQIYGNNNAVMQSQESNQDHSSVQPDNKFFPNNDQTYHQYPPNDDFFQIDGNENFQASDINGNNNMISQGQTSNRNNVVGAPYLIHFENAKPYYPPERSSNQIHPMKRRKRQIKIWNLITDPNSQLDVSQTIENVGLAARNAMADEKHPNFHIKNAVGSAKNAIMSGMRIIPQGFIIPSDYKIVGKSDEPIMLAENGQSDKKNLRRSGLQATNPNLLSDSRRRTTPKFLHDKFDDVLNEDQFVKTYTKVGSMVRDSVRSSKETLDHIGNVYSNARKAVSAARHSAPKMLMRSMRIPEVRRNFPHKPLEMVGSQREFQDDFVGASEMMRSFGLLTPKSQRRNFKRNTRTDFPSTNGTLKGNSQLSNQMPNDYIADTLKILNAAKNVVGAKSLNAFLLEMQRQYISAYGNKMKERNFNHEVSAEDLQQSLDAHNTFDILKSLAVSNDDVLGSSLQGNTFKTSNEKTDYENKAICEEKCKNYRKGENGLETHDYDGPRCCCPNPSLEDVSEYNEKSRISMTMGDKLVTPYMGKIKYDEPYYDNYQEDIEFYK